MPSRPRVSYPWAAVCWCEMEGAGALKRVLAPFIESFDALDRSVQVRSKAGSTVAAPRQFVVVAWRAVFALTLTVALAKYLLRSKSSLHCDQFRLGILCCCGC